MLSRIAFARQLGSRLPQAYTPTQVAQLAGDCLGPHLSQVTRGAIAGAANGGEALALLVSSPEFQRR